MCFFFVLFFVCVCVCVVFFFFFFFVLRGYLVKWQIQQNFSDSNTDGSFTMTVSNSFLSPKEKLQVCDDFRVTFFCYIDKWHIVCTHKNRLDEAILIRTHNLPYC